MERAICVFFFLALLLTVILTGCSGTTISEQDLTNARQASYNVGYNQGLEPGEGQRL